MMFLCIITGMFKELISISILLLVHELGHFSVAKFFKWKVKKIVFYPFGGLTIYEDVIDKPLLEEFVVTIMGPIFQIIIYLIFAYLKNEYYISEYFFNFIRDYNYGILLLNLLPIVPLDGSKILNIMFNKFISFKKAYILTLYFSIITLIMFLFYIKNDSSYYMLIIFLVYEALIYFKYRKFIYNKFLLEKKLYKNNYKKIKKIKKLDSMQRNKRHLFYKNNMYISEKQMLNNLERYKL